MLRTEKENLGFLIQQRANQLFTWRLTQGQWKGEKCLVAFTLDSYDQKIGEYSPSAAFWMNKTHLERCLGIKPYNGKSDNLCQEIIYIYLDKAFSESKIIGRAFEKTDTKVYYYDSREGKYILPFPTSSGKIINICFGHSYKEWLRYHRDLKIRDLELYKKDLNHKLSFMDIQNKDKESLLHNDEEYWFLQNQIPRTKTSDSHYLYKVLK